MISDRVSCDKKGFNPLDPKESIYGPPKKKLIHEETAPYTAMKFCMELEEINPLDPKGSTYGPPEKKIIYGETAPHTAMKFCMELEGNISV